MSTCSKQNVELFCLSFTNYLSFLYKYLLSYAFVRHPDGLFEKYCHRKSEGALLEFSCHLLFALREDKKNYVKTLILPAIVLRILKLV